MPLATSERKPAYAPLETDSLHVLFVRELAKATWLAEQFANLGTTANPDYFHLSSRLSSLILNNQLALSDIRNVFMLISEDYRIKKDTVNSILMKKFVTLFQSGHTADTTLQSALLLRIQQIVHYQLAIYMNLKVIAEHTNRTDIAELMKRLIV